MSQPTNLVEAREAVCSELEKLPNGKEIISDFFKWSPQDQDKELSATFVHNVPPEIVAQRIEGKRKFLIEEGCKPKEYKPKES